MLNSRDPSLLRPDVAAMHKVFIDECKKGGDDVLTTGTVRDDEYQFDCYKKGYSKSKTPSFHSVKVGLAFDVCKNSKGREYDDNAFWQRIGAIGKKLGFTWGGDWRSIVDKPHFQWDAGGKYTSAMVRAGTLPPTMPLYKPVVVPTSVLRFGSKGTDVATLQNRLITHGARITADGDFGPSTLTAVKSFQSSHKLTADGIVGAKTWAALYS